MAMCKLCGKPVFSAKVHHAACWEKKMNKLSKEACDHYCRFNRMGLTEEQLNEQHCRNCVLIKMLALGV